MTEPNLCTREQIARATDVRASAAADATIDRLAAATTRSIQTRFHRHFYPTIETRELRWPRRGSLWIDGDLRSVTTLTLDGTTVTGYTLEDRFYGPPFDRIDFRDANIASGDVVSVTGVWGYSDDEAPAGALATAVTDAAATTCTITDASLVGVGDLLCIDTERVVVTGRDLASTTATLSAGVDASASVVTVPVNTGSLVHAGETVTVDAERMLVIDVAANNLIVRRAVDGSTLAAHLSGATVYAPRLLTVTRGAAGTTGATHLIAAACARNVPPQPIVELAIAETIAAMQQESAGWSRTAGTGQAQAGVTPEGLEQLRQQADVYRRNRPRAI